MNVDRRLKAIARKIDAEKVAITVEYDRESWWARRGRSFADWTVAFEWEDTQGRPDGDPIRVHVVASDFGEALDKAEAEINGILMRQRHRADA